MKTLPIVIILFVSLLFSMGLSKPSAYAENENPPVIITQVELGSQLVLLPDNQSCTYPPDPKLTNNCLTDLVSGHKVQCSYFLGSSTCEPLHHWTSGTNQSCLEGYPQAGAPQWFDMYNTLGTIVDLQNFTAFDKFNYRPYGVNGPFPTILELKPHEKCTFPWLPIDQAVSMGLNNMSMAISYNYDGKHYDVPTPSLSDVYNDTRTWQFDGNEWIFAEQNTVTLGSHLPIGTSFKSTFDSPLKQFKSGVNKPDIKCNQDFVLVIKKEGHWPACVNPDTVSKLVLRGWTENPLDELLLRYGNQTQANLVFYEIMNEPKVREWSMKGWKYNSYSYASNSETQKFSATINLYLPPGIGNHLECENGSYALVVMNLKPVEIEHNSTQVGCNIVSFSIAPNESGMTGKNLNSSYPIKLSLLIDNQYANPAQPIGVYMSLNNTSSNKLTLNSEDNWPRSDLSSGSCSNLPFGMAILRGYYTEQNMTDASSLVIYPNLPCPRPPLIKSYTFEPLSNMATQECDSLFSCPGSTNMKIHLKIDGFIDNNGQHRPFNVGKYTIIAGDEWGHVTIQHFTEAYGTPLISSENNCGQFYTAPENQRDLKTVPVLLMNTNSTGCAKLSFTIGYSYNGTVWPRIASFTPILFIDNVHYSTNSNSFSVTPGKDYTNSFKITVMPETIDLANYPVGSKFSVTYIIRPLPNATGFYDQSIPKLVCERYPLAVGFTADQVNASDFNYIYPLTPPCASGPYQLTGVEISGMNYKWVTLP